MKKEKGFTLVELLVAIAILGILTLLALPIISRVQQNNDNSKYKKYSDTLVSSAKLYIDSYSIDMFGYEENGCKDIPYESMLEKDLLKDLQVKDVTCSNPETGEKNTYIRVKKTGDKYEFQESIRCVDKDGTVVYENIITNENAICDPTDNTNIKPTIKYEPDTAPTNYIKTGSTDVKITIQDTDDGLAVNNSLLYAIVPAQADGTNPNPTSITNWNTLSFGNAEREKEKVTKKITIAPENQNDTKYYLFVKGAIRDYTGNEEITNKVIGPFKFDNVPPTCPPTTSITSSVAANTWTNNKITFNINFPADAEKYSFGVRTRNKTTDSWSSYSNGIITNKNDKSNLVISKGNYAQARFYLYDAAGNKSAACSIAGVYQIDRAYPTLKISVYKRNSSGGTTGNVLASKTVNGDTKTATLELKNWLNNTNYPYGVVYKVEASDNVGLKTKTLEYNDKGLKPNSSKINNYINKSAGGTSFYFSADGYRKGKYTITDNVGQTVSITFIVKIDKTKPSKPDITNPSGGKCTTKSFTVKATSSDAMSGKSYWQYKFGSGDWKKVNDSGNFSLKITSNMSKTMYIRVVDEAGNVSSNASTTIKKQNKCNTWPVNNCKIRGSKLIKTSEWKCTHGHYHTTAYRHYCSDSAGNLCTKSKVKGYKQCSKNTYNYVCPSNPYGKDQKWSIAKGH